MEIYEKWGAFLESKEFKEIMRMAERIGAVGLDEHGCRRILLLECALKDAFMAGAGL